MVVGVLRKAIVAALVALVAVGVTAGVWIIVTPRWVFEVSTDKAEYALGEEVEITVTLKNEGFVSHSFVSSIDEPVMVTVRYGQLDGVEVWFNLFSANYSIPRNQTQFVLGAGQSLTRIYKWNQTNIHGWPWNGTRAGKYAILAFVPSDEYLRESTAVFLDQTSINVTASETN